MMSTVIAKRKVTCQTEHDNVASTFEEVCAREMAIHDRMVMEYAMGVSRPKTSESDKKAHNKKRA